MAVKIHPFEVPFSDHMTYSQFVGPQMNRSNRFHQARFPAATQVDACVDAFLDENAFAGLWTVDCEVKPFQAISGSTPKWPSFTPGGLPDVPLPFQASGQVSMLISYHEGEVRWFKPFLL